MKNKANNNSLINEINLLSTNSFINTCVKEKLRVCHYVFCSHIKTSNKMTFEYGINLLKETLKYSFLNKKRNVKDFYLAINYSNSISYTTGIELDINELIMDIDDKKISQNIIKVCDIQNVFIFKNKNIFDFFLEKHTLPLIIILQLRQGIINEINHIEIKHILNQKFQIRPCGGIIIGLLIILQYFKDEKLLKNVLDTLNHVKLSTKYKNIQNIILSDQIHHDNPPSSRRTKTSIIDLNLKIIYHTLLG